LISVSEYFTKLLDIVHENSGDVIKFCGDAVLIMWAVPLEAAEDTKSAAALMSAVCALQLLEECGEYRKAISGAANSRSTGTGSGAGPGTSRLGLAGRNRASTALTVDPEVPAILLPGVPPSPSSAQGPPTSPPTDDSFVVQLSLHCGIACGAVHCMTLGTAQRMEFLLSGPVLHQMGAAETCAKSGQVCVHRSAYLRIRDRLEATPVEPEHSCAAVPAAAPVSRDGAVKNPSAGSSVADQVADAMRSATSMNDETAAALSEAYNGSAAPHTADPPAPAAAVAEVYLLTGSLAPSFLASRTRHNREHAVYVHQQRSCYQRHTAGSVIGDIPEGREGCPTALYIERLAQEVQANQGRPQLRRVRDRVSSADVATAPGLRADSACPDVAGDGAGAAAEAECDGEDQFPLPVDWDTGPAASDGPPSRAAVITAPTAFLSRLRSVRISREGLSTSFCKNGGSGDTTSPVARGQAPSALSIVTHKSSWALPGYGSFSGATSPAYGRRVRQQLQSRMSAALGHTRSSLNFFPASWPSMRSVPSGTISSGNLSSTEEAGGALQRDNSVSLHRSAPALEGMREREGGELLNLGSASADPRHVAAVDQDPAGAAATEHAVELRRLPVAAMKRKLRYGTASVFASVRAHQDSWNHSKEVSSPNVDHHLRDLLATAPPVSGSVPAAAAGRRTSQVAHSTPTPAGTKRARLAEELRKFMHESAVRAIESNTVAFLSELRDVAIVFTQVLDLEHEFEFGLHARPQKVFAAILKALVQFGGSLRQFVVDDKGCVAIGCFGLSGSSNQNNCVQAVEYALSLRTLLQTLGCRSASGITLGRLYCGLVGAGSRCEYAVMGSSVNLAARLMAAGAKGLLQDGDSGLPNQAVHNVLADVSVHLMTQQQFHYLALPSIAAKGYVQPVPVFASVRKACAARPVTQRKDLHTHATADPAVCEGAEAVLLLERDRELARLMRILGPAERSLSHDCSSAHDGPSALPFVIVSGAEGLGRSALLQHVVAALAGSSQRGDGSSAVRVAVVRVDAANQYLPYDLVRELLSQVMGIDAALSTAESSADEVGADRDAASTETSCRASFASTASTVHCALQLRARLRRTSSSKRLFSSSVTVGGRRRTLAASDALRGSATEPRRHSSAGAAVSRRPRANSHCAAVNEAGPSADALSAHTVRFTPTNRPRARTTTTASSDGACPPQVPAATDVSGKIAAWCERHVPANMTLSAAFALCYPGLDLRDVLQHQYLHASAASGGTSSQETVSADAALALEGISTAPVSHALFLLRGVFTVDGAEAAGHTEDLFSERLHALICSEVLHLLKEVLLHLLVLTAVGVLPLATGADVVPHRAAWMLCVDDLHLADTESQALLCSVLATAQRLAAIGSSARGGFIATFQEASIIAATATTTATAAHSTCPSAAGTPSRQRRRWAVKRCSLLCAQYSDAATLISHLHQPAVTAQGQDQIMSSLKYHCEVVTLQRLSLVAVREALVQVLGLRYWIWLLNNAQQAVGVESVVRKGSGLLGCSAARGRRKSMVVRSTVQALANEVEGAELRRNAFSAEQGAHNASRFSLIGGRCSSEARLHAPATPSAASGLSAVAGGNLRCAANAAVASHPQLFQRNYTQAELDAVVDLVYTLSQSGVPAVLMEICTSLRDTIARGVFTSIQELPVVVRRNKLILEVLDELSSVEVAVLKAAAVVGSQFDAAVLAATLTGLDLSQCADSTVLDDALTSLVAAGLLLRENGACSVTEHSSDDSYTRRTLQGLREFRFAETVTQLAIYNLMLQTQRTVAHSVIAAHYENHHRRLCQPEHLSLITHHYLLSDNVKKQVEYLQRSAQLLSQQDDPVGATEHYAELVHVALGLGMDELVEGCRDREVAAIQAVTALLEPPAASVEPLASRRSLGGRDVAFPRPSTSAPHRRRTQLRVFHNKVAVTDEEQAKVRRLTQMELNSTVAASLVLVPSEAERAVAVRQDPFLGRRQAEARREREILCAMPLRALLMKRKVLARWLSLHPEVVVSNLHCWGSEVNSVQVLPGAAVHGVTIGAVCEWLSAAAELLRVSGRSNEALELLAVAVHLHDCDQVIPEPTSGVKVNRTACPDAKPRGRRARTASSGSDDTRISGLECMDATTRCALEFLDSESAHFLPGTCNSGGGANNAALRDVRPWYQGLAMLSEWMSWKTSRPAVQDDRLPVAPPCMVPPTALSKPARFLSGAVRMVVSDLVRCSVPTLRCVTSPPTCDAPLTSELRALLTVGLTEEQLLPSVREPECLAREALLRGEAGSAAVLLEGALHTAIRVSGDDAAAGRCWGMLSLALRNSGCGAAQASRCLELSVRNSACNDPQQWVGCAQHLSLSGHLADALRCLETAEGLLRWSVDSDPSVLFELWALKGWLLVLSGHAPAAKVVTETMQTVLKDVGATPTAVDDDTILVASTQYVEQLELLIHVADGSEHFSNAPASAASRYHGRVVSCLQAYQRTLQQRDREGVPLTSSQVAGLLEGVAARLGITTSATGGAAPKTGPCTLPACMVLCLNLYTAMRDLHSVLDELAAADATEETTHSNLLAAVTVVATAMSHLARASTATAAVWPLVAVLTAQFELLFYQLCQYCGATATSTKSACKVSDEELAHIVRQVFTPSSHIDNATLSATHSRRLKPQGASSAGNSKWWKRWLSRNNSRSSVSCVSYAGPPDSDGQYLRVPAALKEYSRGLTVQKLQRLRSYVQSQVRSGGEDDVDAFAAAARQCQRHIRANAEAETGRNHNRGDLGHTTDDSGGEGGVCESRKSCSTDESRTSDGEGGDARGVAYQRGAATGAHMRTTAVVNISSATATGASAADICLSGGSVAKCARHEVQWELYPFARALYEDVLQQIDVAEERCREELCRYVALLMDRMQ
jgi:class 3 adenylate cyclase